MTVNPQLVLVGHPFAPIGMGENVRCAFRSWRAAHVPARLHDIYRLHEPDRELGEEMRGALCERLDADVQIFHINGDEVAQALAHIEPRVSKRGKRVICPAWELSRYPEEWAQKLELFDEVWAQSRFTFEALSRAVSVPVVHMPESSEARISTFLSRRYFGIPEGSYVFLFFFHLSSFIERKNPHAAIAAFERFLSRRPGAEARFLLKLSGRAGNAELIEALNERIAGLGDRAVVLDGDLTDNEVKNLVRCCDAFVSLHRSEGFGHGLSEAMALGKPVIATAYSGNLDFMRRDNSLLVDFRLIPVAPDAYPHWHDQVWADPDIGQAADYMVRLYDDPRFGRELGRKAAQDIATGFGYRATGLRYLARYEQAWGMA